MKDSGLKKEFLNSMRGVASTVNVISSQYEDTKHAMTASSVVSLSLDPPSMLVCVNKEASIHQILGKERFFCINILAKDQIDLADLCSSADNEYSMPNFRNNSLLSECWDKVIVTSYKFLDATKCESIGILPNWALATKLSWVNIRMAISTI